jgi:hypothetical protein
VQPQITIQEEVSTQEEEVVHQPKAQPYTPHVSTSPSTFFAMSDVMDANLDDPLLQGTLKKIDSNGKAGLVPAALSTNRSVVSHNKNLYVDVQCNSSKSGKRLGDPWTQDGTINREYVAKFVSVDADGTPIEDKPTLRTEMLVQADSDAEKLHVNRILHNTAPVDFKTILNDDETIVMQLRCKGIQGIPAGGDIVGDCWLILTRVLLGEDYCRRVYFYQSAHARRSYAAEETVQDYSCGCVVHHDTTINLSATRLEEAYLDMITIEDQLVHAHYEQCKRSTVAKVNTTRGQALQPACLHDCVSNCPACSVDLCQVLLSCF